MIINVLATTGGEPMLSFALSEASERAWGIGAVVVIGLVAVAYLVFFIGTLISVLGSTQSGGAKLVWIIFAFCAPFLGPVLWFLIGRRQAAAV